MEPFPKQHPQATATIAIHDGEIDTTQWERFKSTEAEGQIHGPKEEPFTKTELGISNQLLKLDTTRKRTVEIFSGLRRK